MGEDTGVTGEPMPGERPGEPSPQPYRRWDSLNWPGIWAPLVAVAGYIAAVFIATLVGMEMVASRTGSAANLPFTAIAAWANLVGLLALGLVSLLLTSSANAERGFGRVVSAAARLERPDWVLVLILVMVVTPVQILIAATLAGYGLPIDPMTSEILMHPASQAGAVLVAPVAEELWGRGLVYGALRRWGPWVAVVGATLVTAAVHLELVRILSILPGMFALSWLRYRTGRLGPCVVLHAGNNLLAVVLSNLGI